MLVASGADLGFAGEGDQWAMRTTRLLTSVVLLSAAFAPWALAQNGEAGLPSAVSSGSYGAGSYSKGFTGPGNTGPGSYGSGFYGPGFQAAPSPTTPFTYFQSGGAAAGTPSFPSR